MGGVLLGPLHLAVTLLGLCLAIAADGFEAFDEQEHVEVAKSCEERGGSLVLASLFEDSLEGAAEKMFGSIQLLVWPRDYKVPKPGSVETCIPQRCASPETLMSHGCEFVKASLIENLELQRGPTSFELSLTRIAFDSPWLLEGVHTELSSLDQQLYNSYEQGGRKKRPLLHAAVVGHHGPLSLRAAELFHEAVATFGFGGGSGIDEDQVAELSFFGQCYLCADLPACRDLHMVSSADASCGWFLGRAVSGAEVAGVAMEVADKAQQMDAVICLFGLLCYALFALLPAAVQRMQILCMSPLHGVPDALARDVLHDLRTRLLSGEPIFSTNAVTAALVSYHFGGDSRRTTPTMTLFPHDVFQASLRLPWTSSSRKVLFGNMPTIFGFCPQIWGFVHFLRRETQFEIIERAPHWNYANEDELAAELGHRAVVYVPETPYKNSFNDFYAMGLPAFVPVPGFLGRLWTGLQHPESSETYDGWFDRRLPRLHLVNDDDGSRGDGPPEPFNLDEDGEAKVLHWLRLADYYHFPGVSTFSGGAHLIGLLASSDLDAARRKMRRHVARRHAAALHAARELLLASPGFFGG